MQQAVKAYIFPAFSTEHPYDHLQGHRGFSEQFEILLEKAYQHLKLQALRDTRLSGTTIIHDELTSQFVTYIYSCALDDFFKQKFGDKVISAGYSMGLYAALYHAGSVSFTQGLAIIRTAYDEIRKVTGDAAFGMASVIGLEENEILQVIGNNHLSLEITNRNNPVAFVVSGKQDEVRIFTASARDEGALNVHMMNVGIPYHSRILGPVEKSFMNLIQSMHVRKPETGVISLVDQTFLENPESVETEIVRNLYTHLDWCRTQEYLAESRVSMFVEMGPGNGLVKNSRFIEGSARFVTATDYLKISEK